MSASSVLQDYLECWFYSKSPLTLCHSSFDAMKSSLQKMAIWNESTNTAPRGLPEEDEDHTDNCYKGASPSRNKRKQRIYNPTENDEVCHASLIVPPKDQESQDSSHDADYSLLETTVEH